MEYKNDKSEFIAFAESGLGGKKSTSIDVCLERVTKVIDEEFLDKPCAQYSGGMKRRVEIVRAIMADSDIVVMDEPFAGLDDTTKNKVIGYIMDNIGDRILIISTHDLSDAEKLGAKVFFVDA